MPRDTFNLGVTDVIHEINTNTYARIKDMNPVRQKFTQSLTSSEIKSNQKINELQSSKTTLFLVVFLEIENDMKLYMTHRGVNLFYYTGQGFIDGDSSPVGDPFPLGKYFYQDGPIIDYVNNIANNVTGTWYATGIKLELEILHLKQMTDKEAQDTKDHATPISG